jgi:hypothetical protein
MAIRCVTCGHSLAEHLPDPKRPFAWPCKMPGCACHAWLEPRRAEAETSGVGWPD